MGYVCSIKEQVTSPSPFFFLLGARIFSSVQKTANAIPVSSPLTCQEGACLLLEALPPSGHCWQITPTPHPIFLREGKPGMAIANAASFFFL